MAEELLRIIEIGDNYPFVFPTDQGWEADDEAQDPHGCNQQPCSPRRHDLWFRKFKMVSWFQLIPINLLFFSTQK